jgi:hypothetical protein
MTATKHEPTSAEMVAAAEKVFADLRDCRDQARRVVQLRQEDGQDVGDIVMVLDEIEGAVEEAQRRMRHPDDEATLGDVLDPVIVVTGRLSDAVSRLEQSGGAA